MFSPTILLSLLTASAFAQQPNPNTIPNYDEPFNIVARAQGHFYDIDIRAQSSHFYIEGPQYAQCENNARKESATFIRKHDTSLYLYTPGNPMQQTWVDGGGLAGFSNGQGNGPPTADYGPWQLDPSTAQIKFDGKAPYACPIGGQGKWDVWFFEAGKVKSRCFGITLQGYRTPGSPRCKYAI